MKSTYSYVDALNEVLTTCSLSHPCEDKLTTLRDQIAKRNATKSTKPTKAQVENEKLRAVAVSALKAIGGAHTVSEVMALDGQLSELTNQKVSALLNAAVSAGEVIKTVEKRKSYFRAA